MSSFADLIASFARNADGSPQSIEVTRETDGHYDDDGIWVPGTNSTFTAIASVQPMGGEDLLTLPEGDREKEMLKVFCATELQNFDETSATQSDKVKFRGADYQVASVKFHATHGVYVAVISRVTGTTT